jgi:hypothetical protein
MDLWEPKGLTFIIDIIDGVCVCVCVCVYVCTCHSLCVEVREQLLRSGFWASSSGVQVWQ